MTRRRSAGVAAALRRCLGKLIYNHRRIIERLQATARRRGRRLQSRNGRMMILMPDHDEAGVSIDEAARLLDRRRRA